MALDRKALFATHADDLAKMDAGCNKITLNTKLAYFRASKGDVEVATTRIQETLKWREEIGFDSTMVDPTWLKKERECRYLLKYDFLGTDKFGRPVMVERVGQWSISDILNAADDPETFLKLHCMACETMLQMERPEDTLDTRGQVIIMDCSGLSAWHLNPRLARVFGRLAKNDAAHYPDTLAHIFVVNAPYLFSALAKLISPFMDPDTYSKVHVSSGLPDELLECVGAYCLPAELGGRREKIYPYHEGAPLSEHPIPKCGDDGCLSR